MQNTLEKQYHAIYHYCFEIYEKKLEDYGPSWILYRLPSLIDEIWRKAKRIRTLEEKNDQCQIPEGRDVEYVGIINYCMMALMQIEGKVPSSENVIENLSLLEEIEKKKLLDSYGEIFDTIQTLMLQKNADYGNAWKSMEISSMTDQVIMRVYRIKTILKHGGTVKISEGIDAQLQDIINYCFFALIRMETAWMRED